MSPQATATPEAADLAERFVGEIDERMDVLKPFVEEFNSLSDMRSRVTGKATPARRTPGGGNSTGATRARSGTRLEEFIEVVKANPGITVSEAAQKMNVQPNYLYRKRDEAVEQGVMRQDDEKKLHPVG